jgi:hypothetical protein
MDEHLKQSVSPWISEQDPVRRAALGKLAEELGECVAAVSRCLIQGVDEHEPVTKVPNLRWLENELADVEAAIAVLRERLPFDLARTDERRTLKADHFRRWHAQIAPDEAWDDPVNKLNIACPWCRSKGEYWCKHRHLAQGRYVDAGDRRR